MKIVNRAPIGRPKKRIPEGSAARVHRRRDVSLTGRRRVRPIQPENSTVFGVVAERKIMDTWSGSMMITCTKTQTKTSAEAEVPRRSGEAQHPTEPLSRGTGLVWMSYLLPHDAALRVIDIVHLIEDHLQTQTVVTYMY